jgi:spore maturation protein CgeB
MISRLASLGSGFYNSVKCAGFQILFLSVKSLTPIVSLRDEGKEEICIHMIYKDQQFPVEFRCLLANYLS